MTVNRRRVLLLDPDAGLRAAATTAGCDTWSVECPGTAAPGTDRRLSVDLDDVDALHSALVRTARTHEIPHIVYLGDSEVLHLAVERALRELSPARAEPLRRLRDPAVMRRILNQSGVSVVRAEPAATVEAVRALVEDFPLPVAVKAGPVPGTTVVRNRDDLEKWVADAPAGPHLVEEFLSGPRVSVDTLTCEGMHEVTGMTTGTYAGAGLLHPAALSEAATAEIRTAVRALLDLAGLQSGPAHTQVVVTADGPRIAASKARLGPRPIRRLLRASTGRVPEEDVLAALCGSPRRHPAPGRPAALARLPLSHRGADLAAALDVIGALDHVDDVRVAEADADGSEHVEVVVHGGSRQEVGDRLAAVRRRWDTLREAAPTQG
ncbi:acetyl-CoA carboxylase biotin carboxylase subunit family protein [Streptomyces sp. NPDC050548]|uniref:acetyl-CoA carboxylase biotin carboxylase subunit family protein n=1 Tax=Streptomyces sp. NPDC050548 TaxID=3365629 RepID=UPI0037A4D08D